MKQPLLIAVAAALAFKASGVAAGELPTYELMGLPISPHQMSVLGPAGVQEQLAAPAAAPGEMPASPHQRAVLMPRPRIIDVSANLTTPVPAP
jgi:hypothetical protein